MLKLVEVFKGVAVWKLTELCSNKVVVAPQKVIALMYFSPDQSISPDELFQQIELFRYQPIEADDCNHLLDTIEDFCRPVGKMITDNQRVFFFVTYVKDGYVHHSLCGYEVNVRNRGGIEVDALEAGPGLQVHESDIVVAQYTPSATVHSRRLLS